MGGLFRSFTDYFDPGKGRLCLIRGQGRAAQGGVAATAGWAVRLRNRNRPTQFSKGKEWWAARPGKDRERAAPMQSNLHVRHERKKPFPPLLFCRTGTDFPSACLWIARLRVQSLKPAYRITATSGVDKWPSLYAADLPVQGLLPRGIVASFFIRFIFAIYPVVFRLSFLSIKNCYISFHPIGRFPSKSAVEM